MEVVEANKILYELFGYCAIDCCSIRVLTVILEYSEQILTYFGGDLTLHLQFGGLY